MPDPLAPGTQTTEFKVSVVSNFIAAVVALVALVHPGFHVPEGTQISLAVVSVAAIGVVSSVYTGSRAKVKAAALSAPSFAANQVDPSPGGQF